ncbi:MAG: NOL1/NOP2/sun family putative RNA methylase [Candidatus Peribacteraceae bacterium]
MKHSFDRYAAYTDLTELKDYSARPLRKSLRANLLKCSPEGLRAWGTAKGWQMEPVPWCTEGFFVDREDRTEALGKDLLHMLGYTYMQEASSMLPVVLLDPQPGETILDMSSAPGSKTTQIASRMRGKGVIIANDVQEKRIWGLLSNLLRSGTTNVVVTKKVGQWFGGHMTEMFDRVLCDAPCTAEGTTRKDSDALRYTSDDNIGKMSKLQRELLESAVHACKVGGRIVYSTCTLTPEENEQVIASVLNTYSDQLSILDPGLKSEFDFSNAINDSKRVQPLVGIDNPFPAVRVWPQTYNTEGFFVCVLEKHAPTKHRQERDQELHHFTELPRARVAETAKLASDWYGTSFIHEGEVLIENKENELCLIAKEVLELGLPTKSYYAGMPFGKVPRTNIFRISHEAAVLRGRSASSHVMEVTELEFQTLLSGGNLASRGLTEEEGGDILLRVLSPAFQQPIVVGRGILKGSSVLNRMPRDMVRMFT